MTRTSARPPLFLRLMPVVRRMLAVVLAFSFATALSLPTQAMGPHCADPPDGRTAALASMAQAATGLAPAVDHPSGHHSGHQAAPPASAAPTLQAPHADAPQPKADSHMACCLTACPGCLPVIAGGPGLATPSQAQRTPLPPKTRLPDGLPPGVALDPPRSVLA